MGSKGAILGKVPWQLRVVTAYLFLRGMDHIKIAGKKGGQKRASIPLTERTRGKKGPGRGRRWINSGESGEARSL